MKPEKILIVDISPILYSSLISVTAEAKREGIKPVDGVIPFSDTLKKNLIFRVFDTLADVRLKYRANEVIIAPDTPNGGYWRKDIYDRYKYKRKESRDASDIPWDDAFLAFDEIKLVLEKATNFIEIDVPKTEGDDVGFVLSEFLSTNNHIEIVIEIINYTIDKDWIHNLIYPGVRVIRTRGTQRKNPIEEFATKQELQEKIDQHSIQGDKGDGFLHIKSWTQFSPEFLKLYPKMEGKESEAYDKHHKIEKMFVAKTGYDAYKHPRFGYKSFIKTKKSLETLFKENSLYEKNYRMNQRLALPEMIPDEIKNAIIQMYLEKRKVKNFNSQILMKYFRKIGPELLGKLPQFK